MLLRLCTRRLLLTFAWARVRAGTEPCRSLLCEETLNGSGAGRPAAAQARPECCPAPSPWSYALHLHTHTHSEHEYTHTHRVWKAETHRHVSSCVHRILLTTDVIVLQTVEHHSGMFYRLMTSQWTGLLVMSAVPSSWLFLQCHIWDRTRTVSPAPCQMTWRVPNNQWKGLWMQQYRKQILHFTTKPVRARLPRHM